MNRNLRKGLAGGLLVPEDAVLYAPCAARFLMERAQSNGAKLFLGSPVTRIEQGSIRTADGNEIMAKHIVNAAGANAAELSPELRSTSGKATSLSPTVIRAS